MQADFYRRWVIIRCQFRLAVEFYALGRKHDLRVQHPLLKSPTVHMMVLFRTSTFLQMA
jgi:hypothetical protein